MLDIKVSSEQLKYAYHLVKQHNFGNRGIADGNKTEQFIGILGQVVTADLLKLKRPDGSTGFDGGYDFLIDGNKVDVKTMGRTVAMKNYYVHNFIGWQKDFEVDYYLFCSFNKRRRIMTICGWISKADFFKKATLYKQGTRRYRENGTHFETKADLYEIKQRDLNKIDSTENLFSLLPE